MMERCLTDFVIPNHPVFQLLECSILDALLGKCQSKVVSKNTVVFYEGSIVDGLYFLTSGLVKITRLSIEGEQQLINISSSGDVVGEMALYDDGVRSATVTALADSTFTVVPKKQFFDFADEHPIVYRVLLGCLSQRLRETNNSFARNHFLSVSGQIAAALLRLAETTEQNHTDGSVVIVEGITHNDIASMIGAARENVSRVVGQLKKDGIIVSEGGRISLLDVDALQRMSSI